MRAVTGPANGGDRDARYLSVILVLVGLGLLAHPLYLWPHYGQTHVGVGVEGFSEPPDSATDFEELPPAAQQVFRRAVDGESIALWTGEDDRVIEAFDESNRIRYQDEYHQVILFYSHPGSFLPVFLRWLLTAVSALLVAYGSLVAVTGSWRTLTPVRSLLVPATVTAGFLGTAAYDVALSGASGSVLRLSGGVPGVELLQLVPITSLFVVVGSLIASKGLRSRAAIGGAAIVLLVAYARFLPGLHLQSMLILAAYTAIGGIAWVPVGYGFSPQRE